MQQLLTRHKYECITAAICGSLCLAVFVAPWLARQLALPQEKAAIVYQTKTGKPLLKGSSVRDAVEMQLNVFRSVVAQVKGIDLETAEWTDISAKLSGVPRDTADAILKLSGSFYAADLRHADLRGLDFRGVALQHAEFAGANLSGARLDGGQLTGASFASANLSGATFGRRPVQTGQGWPAAGNAPGALFQDCDFEGETLSGRFSGASFKGANLRKATLRLWYCKDLDLRHADLSDGAIEIVQAANPEAYQDWDSGAFYATVKYDDNTLTQNLRLTGVTDPGAPFVQWAIAHGAVLVEPPSPTQ